VKRQHTWGHVAGRFGRIALALAAVVVLGADLFIITQRKVTTPVTRTEALRRFRSGEAEAPTGDGGAASTTSSSTTIRVLGSPSANAPRSANKAAASPASANTASVATSPIGPYVLPREGVYAYRTTGGETISLAGASHSYPAETYGTVRSRGGCQWQTEFDVIKEHVEKHVVCSERGRLLDVETVRSITFFGRTETEDARCDPPLVDHTTDEPAGTTLRGVCRSSDSTINVALTFVGREPMRTGDQDVQAIHLDIHADLSGRAKGTDDDHMWLDPQTGLVLRWIRSSDADADAAFGATIHYRERATFVLESLTPST